MSRASSDIEVGGTVKALAEALAVLTDPSCWGRSTSAAGCQAPAALSRCSIALSNTRPSRGLKMNSPKPMFVRQVSRIDNPTSEPGSAAGHRARRLIDAADSAFADPFLIMAEDWTSQTAFPVHPHRGIETVTFVIEGSIAHSDSAGHAGVLHAGDAQWMTAGRGVTHEENTPDGTTAHTLQLWVNLPAAGEEDDRAARYQDLVGGTRCRSGTSRASRFASIPAHPVARAPRHSIMSQSPCLKFGLSPARSFARSSRQATTRLWPRP